MTGARPFTTNAERKLTKYQRAAMVRVQRGNWAVLAMSHKVPMLDLIAVVCLPLHKDKRAPQDPGACAPELKAAVDGLRDAGVIPEDTSRHVGAITYLPPLICGEDGMTLRVIDLRSRP